MTIKGKFVGGLVGLLIGGVALGSGCVTTQVYEPGTSQGGDRGDQGGSDKELNKDSVERNEAYSNINKIMESIEGYSGFQNGLIKISENEPFLYEEFKKQRKETDKLIREGKYFLAKENYFGAFENLTLSLDRVFDEEVGENALTARREYEEFLLKASEDLFNSKMYEDSKKLAEIFMDTFAEDCSMASARNALYFLAHSDYEMGETEKNSKKIYGTFSGYLDDGRMGALISVNVEGETQEIYYNRASSVILNSEEELFREGQTLEIWVEDKPIAPDLPSTTFLKVRE